MQGNLQIQQIAATANIPTHLNPKQLHEAADPTLTPPSHTTALSQPRHVSHRACKVYSILRANSRTQRQGFGGRLSLEGAFAFSTFSVGNSADEAKCLERRNVVGRTFADNAT